MFDTVLVANRGEIAVRVLRTLRRLGVRSVAVHAPDDAGARHVAEADTAVALPGGYLDADAVVAAGLRTGAQAVHPGYGFLSENAAFATAVTKAGMVFVGPPASAIELMGDKIRAKETVAARGVPVVPGAGSAHMTDGELAERAREIGLPVLLKPSAGGGGKGMRLVRDAAALAEAIDAARREALGAFGNGTLLVERWIDRPRHIEFQVLADEYGRVIHLGERECSLQRRHQKIIEEAPSVLLDPATRAAMGESAIEAARSCGYVGAGTVEFIVPSGDPGAYYFMEMNTRLQVEHPVTEMVTGIDLVEAQLLVAAGAPLPAYDATAHGHAIEARVYAEDPDRGFLPTGGRVLMLRQPDGADGRDGAEGVEGVRVDSALAPGTVVGSAYDPMLAKVIAHGPDRPTAISRLRAALAATRVLGVTTNIGHLHRLLADPDVVAGRLDTGLVEALTPDQRADPPPEVAVAVALAVRRERAAPDRGGWTDPFSVPSGWRVGGRAWDLHRLTVGAHGPVDVRVREHVAAGSGPPGHAASPDSPGYEVTVDGGEPAPARIADAPGGGLLVTYAGITSRFDFARESARVHWLARGADTWRVAEVVDTVAAGAAAAGDGALLSPMPGTVALVRAAPGDRVTRGQTVVVVEAMKMEHALTAPFDGVVRSVAVVAGATVAMDQTLAVIEAQEG